MRILIVNKFLYPRGGDCIAAMTTMQLLKDHGHEVQGYAMSYPKNISLPDNKYYASEVSFNGSISAKLTASKRMLGYGNIRNSVNRILDDFLPDVVHLHNIHSYLSPIIGEIAHKRGIKVFWTLHDYKLLCPAYTCLQPSGHTCQECYTGNLNVIKHRCMKNNLIASILAHAEAKVWNHRRLSAFTTQFIAPSRFMYNKIVEGGFDKNKISILSNIVAPERVALISKQDIKGPKGNYFCYVGRLSKEKGIETLLSAASQAGISLQIAGDGPLKESLIKKYHSNTNIKFLGQLNSEGVINLITHAIASVIPSEWYENNPIGVIESLSCGTPVIGADIGGIPELITPANGLIYQSGSSAHLTAILKSFDSTKFDSEQIAKCASASFNADVHYKKLLSIYTK